MHAPDSLHAAAHAGDIEALSHLANVDHINAFAPCPFLDRLDGEPLTPLMIAAASPLPEATEAVRWLLEHGANPQLRSENGATAAWLAVDNEDAPDAMRLGLLLDAGVSPDEMGAEGSSLLEHAANLGNAAIVGLLLERGANPEGPSGSATRPLVAAALAWSSASRTECVRRLLDAGADAHVHIHNATTGDETDLLSSVLEQLHFDEDDERLAVADVLCDHGAAEHWTAAARADRFSTAANWHNFRAVRWLLQHGASMDAGTSPKGWTLLHTACWVMGSTHEENQQNCRETLALLIAARADVNAADKEGNTPLHEAAGGDYPNEIAAAILLEHGAFVDPVNKEGETPLHIAASWGAPECVRVLLEAGADPARRNQQGERPLDQSVASIEHWYDLIRDYKDDPQWMRDSVAECKRVVELLEAAHAKKR